MIKAGDVVLHHPTGEQWYVLGVKADADRICPAGWPASIGKLSDCTLVRSGSGISTEERNSRAAMFPGYSWDEDPR